MSLACPFELPMGKSRMFLSSALMAVQTSQTQDRPFVATTLEIGRGQPLALGAVLLDLPRKDLEVLDGVAQIGQEAARKRFAWQEKGVRHGVGATWPRELTVLDRGQVELHVPRGRGAVQRRRQDELVRFGNGLAHAASQHRLYWACSLDALTIFWAASWAREVPRGRGRGASSEFTFERPAKSFGRV
jgi:hypothetical protein